MRRLLCGWPPPEADRDCRQRKHLQTSHNGWIENGMDLLFWPQVFQKGSAVETSWTPPHKEKNFSFDLPVPGACAQGPVVHCNSESTVMFSCTLALGRPSYCASVQRTIHDRDELVGRFAKAGHAGATGSPTLAVGESVGSPTVDVRGELLYRGLSRWQSRTLALDPNFEIFFKINFPFVWKMCDLWFSIRN